MTPMAEDTSWAETRRLILSELERMDKSISALGGKIDTLRDNGRDQTEKLRKEYDDKISAINVQIAMMQVKMAVGASILSVATSVLVSWLMRGH